MLAPRIILFGTVAAQLTDTITFTYGVSRYGIGLESNWMVSWLFEVGGLQAILIVKGIAILATIALLAASASRFPRLLVWGGATATSIGLLGFATNTLSLAILAG